MMVLFKILWMLKSYVYILLISMVPFYSTTMQAKTLPLFKKSIGLSTVKRANNQSIKSNEGHYKEKNMLLKDYTDLVNHSKELSRFGVTAEAFNSHFEEGLNASLTFLASSGISKAKVKNLIVKNFYDNPSLPHQIERPHLTKINLPLALHSLRQFSGAWYGNWKEIRVNHYWLPVRQTTKTISDQVTLLGFQSCFTGDGYGWNYVVKQNNHILILGFVVHLDDHGKIIAKNPHYAFLNNKKQLIWVSEDHIYYEFICRHDTANKRHYVISGAGYEKLFGKLTLAGGFQTIYSSNNEDLPAFKNINLKQSKS